MNYPHVTKDSKGNMIYSKESNGYESWQEFDKNNNMIHFKNSNGNESWYDSKGNEIPNPDSIKEISMDEIAKLLNIDVKNLKIKK